MLFSVPLQPLSDKPVRFVDIALEHFLCEHPSVRVPRRQLSGPLAQRGVGEFRNGFGDEPLAKRQVGIVHNGSAHHGELVITRAALPAVMLWQFQYVQAATPRATHRVQHTPAGQRSSSIASRHSSSFGNFSSREIRFMAQKPPEKKKHKLPEDALKRGGRHLLESIFGDEVMAEVDKVVAKRSEKKKDGK